MSDAKKYNPYNLIVNYLPQTMTENELQTLFSRIGKIKSCKIIKDKETGISFGYGFIEFERDKDAENAIQILDGESIENKKIKVAYARQGENIKGANLYVKNIPKDYTADNIKDMFSSCGRIISSRVLVDPLTGHSRCAGFVLFDTKDEAALAIDCMNGVVPEGSSIPLSVKFAEENKEIKMQNFKTKMQQQLQSAVLPQSKLQTMFANSNQRMNINLNHHFQSFSVIVPPLAQTLGLGAGYQGLVGGGPLRTPHVNHRYNPSSITCQSQTNGAQNIVESNGMKEIVLFVYNIGSKTDERALWKLFSPFGAIKKISIIQDKDKNGDKNFGFVTMVDIEEASCAIQQLNGIIYGDKPLQVSIKKPKGSNFRF